MKRIALAALLLAAASSAAAQSSISVSIVQPQYSSQSVTSDGDRAPIDLGTRTGYGVGFAHRWQRISATIDVMRLTAPGTATISGIPLRVGNFDTTTLSALADVHTGRGIDPYFGAGVAWVRSSDLHSDDLDLFGIGPVSIGNDVTYVLNGGIDFPLRHALHFAVDARYMPVSVEARNANGTATVKYNALTLGAAIRWSF